MRLENFESQLRPGVQVEATVNGAAVILLVTYKGIVTKLNTFLQPHDNKHLPGYHRKHPQQLIEEINAILDKLDES